jgi:hypothetical protein
VKRPNPIADRFLAELHAWLTPDLLYHAFTGETDEYELARIAKLDPWLLEPLLNKVERLWPERLRLIAESRRREKKDSKAAVQLYISKIHS